MKKVAWLLSFIILSTFEIKAYEICGRVMENDSTGIEFANIAAFERDSLIGGGISDENGKFIVAVNAHCDRIRISSIGYADKIITSVKSDLGNIILVPDATMLNEIVVKAPLLTREADRIIMNVAANPLSADKDAQELLKTAPGVWTTDQSISIYGQSGTAVYIDDRKVNLSGNQLMTYLKSIRSSSIATIEIIPKAGAEYSADSSGGIVKINLKRRGPDGLTGSAGMNITAGEWKQWMNPFANFSLHNGKWTFNMAANLNGSPGDRYVNHEESVYTSNEYVLKGSSRHKGKSLQGNISIGLFNELSEKDKIGLQIDCNPSRTNHLSNSETERFGKAFLGSTYGRYDSNEKFLNLTTALNWHHTLDGKGSILKIIANFNHQESSVKENNVMGWSDIINDSIYYCNNVNRYNILATEISVRKIFNSGWRLNIGSKYTFNNVSNKSLHKYLDNQIWMDDEKYDYDDRYSENIIALFATTDVKAGRWKLKGGLRAEYYKVSGRNENKNRLDLFPNVNIAYNITAKGDYVISSGYYRHIRRPSFRSLDPGVRQFSDYTYSVVNPNLSSSKTDAISLDVILAGRFTIAGGYSITVRPIRQMYVSKNEYPDRMYLTWENEGKNRNLFLHADGSVNITDWWNMYSSITYIHTSQQLHESEPFDTFGYVQLVASANFRLPKDCNLAFNCFFNSKMKIGNITVYPILNVTPTFQKRFGKHWSVSLGIENMLQRKNKTSISSSQYSRFSYSKSYMTAKLGITYNFNSGKSFKSHRIEKNVDNSRLSKD